MGMEILRGLKWGNTISEREVQKSGEEERRGREKTHGDVRIPGFTLTTPIE